MKKLCNSSSMSSSKCSIKNKLKNYKNKLEFKIKNITNCNRS